MKKVLLSLALTALLVPGVRAAEDKDPVKLPKSDLEFLPRAISCSVAETKYAELAEKRAEDKEVKEFARKLAADHQKCTQKLLDFAKDLKLAVVAGTESDQRATEKQLAKLSGRDFDVAYLREVISDHEKGIKVAQSRIKGEGKEELKDYLKKSVEEMEGHLKEARGLLARVEKSEK